VDETAANHLIAASSSTAAIAWTGQRRHAPFRRDWAHPGSLLVFVRLARL